MLPGERFNWRWVYEYAYILHIHADSYIYFDKIIICSPRYHLN